MSLNISRESVNSSIVLHLAGEAAMSTAAELEAALVDAADDGALRIIVDLSEVKVVSSLVMGTLVKHHKLSQKHGRSLRLAALQPSVRRSFEIARLDQFVAIFASVDDALS